MLLIFLHYQYSFPQLAFPENPRQQATFTPHPAKGTPECTEVRIRGFRKSKGVFSRNPQHDLEALSISPRP